MPVSRCVTGGTTMSKCVLSSMYAGMEWAARITARLASCDVPRTPKLATLKSVAHSEQTPVHCVYKHVRCADEFTQFTGRPNHTL